MRASIVQSKSFAYVGPSNWTPPVPGIIIPVTYPAAEMTLDRTVLLTQALMPLESIVNLNDATCSL